MNTERLKQYANLKQQIAKLESEADMIKSTVLEDVKQFITENDGVYPEIDGVGKFNIKTRKVWSYSADYEFAKDALAQLKKEEEKTGIASYDEQEQLEFRIYNNE